MSIRENIQIVKDAFAAMGRGDLRGLLALSAEDIERVLVVGSSAGKIKATSRTFEDHFVFAITVRNGKLTDIRESIDTLALARASGRSV